MNLRHLFQVTSSGATPRSQPRKRRLRAGGLALAVACAGLAVVLTGCGPASSAGSDHATPATKSLPPASGTPAPPRSSASQHSPVASEGSSPGNRNPAPAMTGTSAPTSSMPTMPPSSSAPSMPSTPPASPLPTAPATISGTNF
jgi:hypothetical protein